MDVLGGGEGGRFQGFLVSLLVAPCFLAQWIKKQVYAYCQTWKLWQDQTYRDSFLWLQSAMYCMSLKATEYAWSRDPARRKKIWQLDMHTLTVWSANS